MADITSTSYAHFKSGGSDDATDVSNNDTSWTTDGNFDFADNAQECVGIDFGVGKEAATTSLKLYFSANLVSENRGIKNFIFQGANSPDDVTVDGAGGTLYANDTGWTNLKSDITANTEGWQEFTYTTSVKYRYFRLKMTDAWGSSSAAVLPEWEIHGVIYDAAKAAFLLNFI